MLLPGGGILIDTPGMRELQLWEAGERWPATFADIDGAGGACRFRDCRHRQEPGCAVTARGRRRRARRRAASRASASSQPSSEHAERQQDERALLERKRQGRIGAKAIRQITRIKDRT